MTISVDKVDLYTQAVKSAFVNAYEAVAEPAPIMSAVTEITSGGRVENYPWLYPPPMLSAWQGYRKYATLGETQYRVENKTFSAAFKVLFEDLEDEQIPGFKRQAANMAEMAKVYPGIQVLQTLAAGQTTLCMDRDNFFSTARTNSVVPWTFPTGGNILTGTASGTDGATHAMACLVTANKIVKPLLWQIREPATFRTNAGNLESDEHRVVKHWATLRGAPAFGFPWDSILVKFANTPTVADIQTTLGAMNARFRGFKYPKNLPDDPDQFIHGQTRWTDKTLLIVCSTGLEHIVRQALTLSLIAQTENYWKGAADLICSGYLDGVV